jgi:hypothetical protein
MRSRQGQHEGSTETARSGCNASSAARSTQIAWRAAFPVPRTARVVMLADFGTPPTISLAHGVQQPMVNSDRVVGNQSLASAFTGSVPGHHN